MIAVRGLMALVVFNDAGHAVDAVRFGAGKHIDAPGVAVGVDTPPGIWHTVIALEPASILFEVKAGPFDPSAPREPAPWAPDEGSEEASAYLDGLRRIVIAGGFGLGSGGPLWNLN